MSDHPLGESPQGLSLVSHRVAALPLINHICRRLQLDSLLDAYVPVRDAREKLPPAICLGVLTRNLALGKHPLYAIAQWATKWEPDLLGGNPGELAKLDDDRVGRALDRLFQADRASLLTEVVMRTVRQFEVALEQLHNDSTTITFTGAYREATGRRLAGQQALRITHGHNKDHRPDLKQLLWVLTVSADGSVPIHYRALDGNTADVVTHLPTWEMLTKLAGRTDFLYVADSKLCDRETMAAIDHRGGRFLTVMPRSRSEDAWFRRWLQTNEPAWQEVSRSAHPRRKEGAENVWRALESPAPSAEGYRIVWVWNSLKALEDLDSRQSRIERALARLEALNEQLANPRSRTRTAEAVEAALANAVGNAAAWIKTGFDEISNERFRKLGPGRPGPDSLYEKEERWRWRVNWKVDVEAVKYDARSDGMFPLITNDPGLALADVLAKYKYQPQLEKRHQALKSVLEVAPVWLKNEGRIEALLFLYYLALLIHALLERELKRAMVATDLKQLPLYPEGRLTAAPTTELMLNLFEDLQVHHLFQHGQLVQTFPPELTALQNQLLELLSITPDTLLLPASPTP